MNPYLEYQLSQIFKAHQILEFTNEERIAKLEEYYNVIEMSEKKPSNIAVNPFSHLTPMQHWENNMNSKYV